MNELSAGHLHKAGDYPFHSDKIGIKMYISLNVNIAAIYLLGLHQIQRELKTPFSTYQIIVVS